MRWLAGAGWTGLLLGLGWVLLVGGLAQAAGGHGFAVSPAFQPVEIAAGQSQVEFELKLTNHASQDQNFRLSAADFGALDEEGGVAFLGQPTGELEHRYGLASWMRLSANAVFVPAGKTVAITVTIDNRASLAPGGHYGAVLATAVTDSGAPVTGSAEVGVRQVLSSLVLVTKDGGAAPSLRLVSQTTDGGWWHLPGQIDQRFEDDGNVHVVPRGVVEVRDPLGRVVQRAALNAESAVILPESYRNYHTSLLKLALAWLPGRYAVVSTYRYDGTEQTQMLTTSFWYAGQVVIWLTILLALVAAGLLGWWLWRLNRPTRLR
ncbi:MAG TPA: hypothetical protein VLI05_05580 [Candidatus Saccharimonadia bacterium]|nr:hypothetical protein [Candidatus Saccharimonadia bacterium]